MRKASIGAVSELAVAADLLANGHEVFRSLSAHASCDLIALMNDQIVRIEVRTAHRRKDGTPSPCVRENDMCDLYAFVCGGDIFYRKPEEALMDIRFLRGDRGKWRSSGGLTVLDVESIAAEAEAGYDLDKAKVEIIP